jgi:protein-L-isoaspartate O-methyltransferase
MTEVDRGEFVDESDQKYSYKDTPLGIKYNVTISAPHMHGWALVRNNLNY